MKRSSIPLKRGKERSYTTLVAHIPAVFWLKPLRNPPDRLGSNHSGLRRVLSVSDSLRKTRDRLGIALQTRDTRCQRAISLCLFLSYQESTPRSSQHASRKSQDPPQNALFAETLSAWCRHGSLLSQDLAQIALHDIAYAKGCPMPGRLAEQRCGHNLMV